MVDGPRTINLIYILKEVGQDGIAFFGFGLIIGIGLIQSLLMLPINLRLTAQLIMQVFKYRYIVKYRAEGLDKTVLSAYLEHFKAILCILIFLLIFNTFNVARSIYFLKSLDSAELSDEYRVFTIIGAFTNISGRYIILGGLVMLYQIYCYFKEEKFRFYFIIIAYTITSVIYFIIYSNLLETQLAKIDLLINNAIETTQIQNSKVVQFVRRERLIIGSLQLTVYIIFPTSLIFAFIRQIQRYVNAKLEEFRLSGYAEHIEYEIYADKLRAGKILKMASWGTFILGVLYLTSGTLKSFIYFIFQSVINPNISRESTKIIVQIMIIAGELFSLLPSIIYSIFLVSLWLYFRNRTKVKYSGYHTRDILLSELTHDESQENKQEELHHTFYKPKNKIILISYVILIPLIGCTLGATISPIFSIKGSEEMQLKPGDYYQLEGSQLQTSLDSCSGDLTLSTTYDTKEILFSKYNAFYRKINTANCSERIFAYKVTLPLQNITETTIYTITPPMQEITEKTYGLLWLTQNSTAYGVNGRYLKMFSEYPCYLYQFDTVQPILDKEIPVCGHVQTTIPDFPIFDCKGENCTVLRAGMYQFYTNKTEFRIDKIIPKIYTKGVPIADIIKRKVSIKNYNFLSYQSPGDLEFDLHAPVRSERVCPVRFTCKHSHIWEAFLILIGVFVVVSAMLSIGVFCIHKI